jgi:hypothetical protein
MNGWLLGRDAEKHLIIDRDNLLLVIQNWIVSTDYSYKSIFSYHYRDENIDSQVNLSKNP